MNNIFIITTLVFIMIYPDFFTPAVKRFKKLLEPIFLPNGGNEKWELILILYSFAILFYSFGPYYVHGALYHELKYLIGSEHTIAHGFVMGSVFIYFTVTLSMSLFLVLAQFFESGKSWREIIKNHMIEAALKHLIFLSIIILLIDGIKFIYIRYDMSYNQNYYSRSEFFVHSVEAFKYSYLIGHGPQFFIITLVVFLNKYKYILKKKISIMQSKIRNEYNNSSISPNEALRKMKKINELLNQGIIDQNEYEDLKNYIKKKTDLNLDRI